jgi:hypothetical protein
MQGLPPTGSGRARGTEFAAVAHDYLAAQALAEAAQATFAAAADERRRRAAQALLQVAIAQRRAAWERLRAAFEQRGP